MGYTTIFRRRMPRKLIATTILAIILSGTYIGIATIVNAKEYSDLPANAEIQKYSEYAKKLAREGKSIQAIRLWELLVRWGEANLGLENPGLATALINLAELYMRTENPSKAIPLLERAVSIDMKVKGENNLYLAGSLSNLAMAYLDTGRIEEADAALSRSLQIYRSALPSNHPTLAIALNNEGQIHKEQGYYDSAIESFKRSILITEDQIKKGSESGLSLCTSLVNLAQAYFFKGNNSLAIETIEQALSIYNRLGKMITPEASNALNILGDAFRVQGRYAEAEKSLKQAVDIRRRFFGENSKAFTNSVGNLALVYKDQGRLDEAEDLYRQAVATEKTARGGVAEPTTIANLGSLYLLQGKYQLAQIMLLDALSRQKISSSRPVMRRILFDLGKVRLSLGHYQQALVNLKKSLAVTIELNGNVHPIVAPTLRMIAIAYGKMGNKERTLEALKMADKAELAWLKKELPYVPQESLSPQVNTIGDAWMWPFGILEKDKKSLLIAASSRLNRQGLTQEIERQRHIVYASSSAHPGIMSRLQFLKRQLSSVMSSGERRRVIREEIYKLESAIYQNFDIAKEPEINPLDIAKIMPPNAALIEFQRYTSLVSFDVGMKASGVQSYMAIIIKSNGSLQSVPLGSAASIDATVQRGLASTAQNQLDAKAIWGQISDLVLRPLLPHLNGSLQWFLSPDGELNRVPFAALPSPQQAGVPLAEAVQLRQLTTGRDLLRLQQPTAKGQAPVVFANPEYGHTTQIARRTTTTTEVPMAQQRSSDLGAKTWSSLPATALEGQRVATMLSARLLTGSGATAARLEQQQGPRILHIATHGFFVADAVSKPQDPLRLIQDQAPQLNALRQEDPQLRSGLVLAGANQPDADPNDDGYLTAAEAVALNLMGTELVVLSACSTGQGDIRTGEGVYGLQRSLAVAGARSTLLSLWKVDDAATLEFMTRFYQRLKAGVGRADALAATQKEFRDGIPGKPDWKDPYYWAAWQLVGDWRPISGL